MVMAGAQVLHRGMTWQEFLDLPDDDRYRHAELINGEVVVTAATPLHQQVVGRLWAMIDGWARAGDGRGEVTLEPAVQISDRTGYLPDVAWFCQAKCAPPGEPPAFGQPPDLVVEVLSPSTRSFDAVRKRHDYAAVGVTELWLIDPDEPAGWVLRRFDGQTQFIDVGIDLGVDDELTSPHLPDLAITLRALIDR